MSGMVKSHRTDKENTYNIVLCITGAIIWLSAAYWIITSEKFNLGLIAFLPYVMVFGLFFFFSSLLFRAKAMGNMILLSEKQLPHIYRFVSEGAKKFSIPEPQAFIYNSNGMLNAFARKVFGRDYLLITSAIVDATSEQQMKFIIGHELAHHAAGHLNSFQFWLRFPATIIPLLHSAYLRQCEYTCDRLGNVYSMDLESSISALSMLGCGCHKLHNEINVTSFTEQENYVPAFSGWILEIFSSHPRLTKRVISLKNYSNVEEIHPWTL